MLAELDNKLGGYNILETINESTSQRLIIRTDATAISKTKVFTVEKNINGNYVVNEYKATYIKGGEAGYPQLSINKTTPDFSQNISGQWLHPQTANKTIKIKVSGQMNSSNGIRGDVELANVEANIDGITTPSGYTWHHLDDFNPSTGECTMQLVKTDIHNMCKPHTGAVRQWENYTGKIYKRN
ncbi:MAG: HNH endonuclease [Hydrotalea flava]|nr:HNH endonuclease [Hydrotalea flava]